MQSDKCNMKRILLHIFTVLGLLVTCVSCRQEICYDHFPSLDVHLSWEQEWERDYGMNHFDTWNPEEHYWEYDALRPEVPEWVKMVRYFNDGRVSERFLMPDGAQFEVDKDEESSVLMYNGDTEYIILSDVASLKDVRATATSRTRAGGTLQGMKEMYGTRTTNSPDVIYSAFIDHLTGAAIHEVKHVPVKMQPLVYTYVVTFEFEYGIEYVSLARGALGGMAEGVYLRTGVTPDEASIILFDCDIHSDACRSRVRSFGIPGFPDSYFGRKVSPESAKPFTLNLELRLKNGKTKEFNLDVSDQIANQPRGGVIKVSGLRVADSEGGQGSVHGGFKVDISDWKDNDEINIQIDPRK